MTAKVHALNIDQYLNLDFEDFDPDERPKLNLQNESWSDRFHRFKGKLSKKIISLAYRVGLGYTTLAESYDEHNNNLFREILIEAQTSQRADENELFHVVVEGNLHDLIVRLKEIETETRNTVKAKMIGRPGNELDIEMRKAMHESAIYKRDVSGASIVHLAYLSKHYDIGHYLVQHFPRLSSQPYSSSVQPLIDYIEACNDKPVIGATNSSLGYIDAKINLRNKFETLKKRLYIKNNSDLEKHMLYTGENILHIAIMRRNYEEVRWILDFYKDHKYSYPDCLSRLLLTEATGQYFEQSGSFYVGSYPLQFAVCSNSTAVFDLVYSFVSALEETIEDVKDVDPSSPRKRVPEDKLDSHSVVSSAKHQFIGPDVIFATDKFGNNILHLCVLHGLNEMYQHVHDKAVQVMRRELQSRAIRYHDWLESANPDERDNILPRDILVVANKLNLSESYPGFRPYEKVLDPKNIKKWELEAKEYVHDRLVVALNNDLHSPLTLAASIINKKKDSPEEMELKVSMLRYLLNQKRKQLWEYGPVTMSILNLDGVEIEYDVLNNYNCINREDQIKGVTLRSAINWLCINDSDKAIQIPEIEKLIQAKWERVGYPFFILSFLINLFLAACVTLILIFVNATPSAHTSYSTELAVNVLYLIVSIIYFIMFIQELNDIIFFGYVLKTQSMVTLMDKILRVFKILSFVSLCIFKVIGAYRASIADDHSHSGATVLFNRSDDQGIKVSLVVCVISSYLHLYYFFMGFDSTGPFVLTMFRIVTQDVPYFLNFYFIVVVAFAAALSVLSRSLNPGAGYGFAHLVKAIWTLIQTTVGVDTTHDNISVVRDYPNQLEWLADILLTCYNAIVIILMLNLLIAMISNTYNAYCEYNSAILLIAKYNIMSAMESVMWEVELLDNRGKFVQVEDKLSKYVVEVDLCAPDEKSVVRLPFKEWLLSYVSSFLCYRRKPSIVSWQENKDSPDIVLEETNVRSRGLSSVTETINACVPCWTGAFTSAEPAEFSNMTGSNKIKRSTVWKIMMLRRRAYKFELQTVNHAWFKNGRVRPQLLGQYYNPNTPTIITTSSCNDTCHESGSSTNGLHEGFRPEELSVHSEGGVGKTALFIIDAQRDFHAGGPLAVPGADEDALRIANMIDDFGEKYIHEIFVSMDSHYPCHIAHAVSWHKKDDPTSHPPDYTKITHKDVMEEVWVHRDKSESMQKWVRQYTCTLERHGKMVLTIWPQHGIVGTEGHGIEPHINAALQRWADHAGRPIKYVMKGQNLRTEMYSALKAEVPDHLDQNTSLNVEVLSALKTADRLLLCGQAMSHCVNFTTRDIIEHWDKPMSHLVLLTDGASPVLGYSADADKFKMHCVHKKVSLRTIEQEFSGCKPKSAEDLNNLRQPISITDDGATSGKSRTNSYFYANQNEQMPWKTVRK